MVEIKYTGNVIVKKIYDMGARIKLQQTASKIREHEDFNIRPLRQSFAMSFDDTQNIYLERLPLEIEIEVEGNFGSELSSEYYFRLYPTGILVLSIKLQYQDIEGIQLKTEINHLMKLLRQDRRKKAEIVRLADLRGKIRENLELYTIGEEEKPSEMDTQRREIGTVADIGISTLYLPDHLFDNADDYLERFDTQFFSNFFVKGQIDEDNLEFDLDSNPYLTTFHRRYRNELIVVGRHSFFIHSPSRGEKFREKAELVYEIAKVQRFLIKLFTNISNYYVKKISEVVSQPKSIRKKLATYILEINLLRKYIMENSSELSDYPSMLVNIHLTKYFEATINIGYGNFEMRQLENNLEILDQLSSKIFEIKKLNADERTERGINRLNLIFIIGVTAQLIAFMTQQPVIYWTSMILIGLSFVTGIILYFIFYPRRH